MQNTAWEQKDEASSDTAGLKSPIPFIVLTEVLNYFSKSICFDLLQICRYLFIEISYLEWVLQTSRSSVPDNDLTAYASWATKALPNPPPLLISSELCNKGRRKSFNACTEPQQLSDYRSDSCSFARMRRGKCCAWYSCVTLNFAWNWWKRFLFAQVRIQPKAQKMPQPRCPPWVGGTKTLYLHLCCVPWFGLRGSPASPYSYNKKEQEESPGVLLTWLLTLSTQTTAQVKQASLLTADELPTHSMLPAAANYIIAIHSIGGCWSSTAGRQSYSQHSRPSSSRGKRQAHIKACSSSQLGWPYLAFYKQTKGQSSERFGFPSENKSNQKSMTTKIDPDHLTDWVKDKFLLAEEVKNNNQKSVSWYTLLSGSISAVSRLF